MIDLRVLSMSQLAALIKAAMDEYQRRIDDPLVLEQQEAPRVITVAPTKQERAFIEGCLRIVKSGGYVRAEQKDKYAQLAKKYEEWMRARDYPTSLRGSHVERWREIHGG